VREEHERRGRGEIRFVRVGVVKCNLQCPFDACDTEYSSKCGGAPLLAVEKRIELKTNKGGIPFPCITVFETLCTWGIIGLTLSIQKTKNKQTNINILT
jgi:hypothetical protein